MGKKEIMDIMRGSKPELESRYGVRKLGLFGSYVSGNGDHQNDSLRSSTE